jgi:hypothetical protein
MGRNVPFASAVSMSLSLVTGLKFGLKATAGLYTSRMISHGAVESACGSVIPESRGAGQNVIVIGEYSRHSWAIARIAVRLTTR